MSKTNVDPGQTQPGALTSSIVRAIADGRDIPTIQIVRGELSRVVRESIAALKRAKVPIYDRGGVLVRPVRLEVAEVDDNVRRAQGSIVLRPVDSSWTRLQLASAAKFVRWVASAKEARPVDPPTDIAALIADVPDEGRWPYLRSVVRHPVLTLDGRWIGRGYHDGLLIDTNGDDDWIEPATTREAALGALTFLREHFQHYLWQGKADESVAISLLISTLMRPVFDAVPLHAVDAPAAGSGKSMLVDVAAILSTGVRAPVMDYGRDYAEAAKRLDAMLLAGDSIVSIDNVEAPLEGSGLCQTLTQAVRRVRPLGASVMVNVPCTAMVTATGNNLVLRGDIVRRALVCRIDPRVEHPELRRFNQDLIAETIEDRVGLVAMCQTIVRAYLAADPVNVAPLGSFEQWSRTVRAALIWLDMPDPISVMERTRTSDPARAEKIALFTVWHNMFGDTPKTSSQLVAEAQQRPALMDVLRPVASSRGGALDTSALGYWLRSNLDTRVGGYTLAQHKAKGPTAKWIVRRED